LGRAASTTTVAPRAGHRDTHLGRVRARIQKRPVPGGAQLTGCECIPTAPLHPLPGGSRGPSFRGAGRDIIGKALV
jgi:hypothetical protein